MDSAALFRSLRRLIGLKPSAVSNLRPNSGGMERRDFLRLLGVGAGIAAVGLTLDPDRLLWVPGAKTIILPPDDGWESGNHFLTANWITKDVARMCINNLKFVNQVDRKLWDESFALSGVSIGRSFTRVPLHVSR